LVRKPAALRRGDLVALVAPAGASDVSRLEAGIRLLESWDLRVDPLPATAAVRYLAAPDSARGERMTAALRDPAVRAVLAVRGGFGSARLRDLVDLAALETDPKIFVGFSDITILLTRILQEADLVCYHGPMVAVDLPRMDEARRERFRRFLFGEPGWWEGGCSDVWRAGRATGPITGGCLSVLVTTLGTAYEVDTNEKILFLEDVAEAPYRIDRMLQHMKHAGKFDTVRGMVLGPMIDCDGGGGDALLREVFLDVLSEYEFPILFGFDAGHGSGNVVIPFGCSVAIDGHDATVELREDAFR